MKHITKQDKLRMLARIACEYRWSINNSKDTGDAHAKLLRFIDRNVESAIDSTALTYDDIGQFDVQDFTVFRHENVFNAEINDKLYTGNFTVVWGRNDTLTVKLGIIFKCIAGDLNAVDEVVDDALLMEVMEKELNSYITDHLAEYVAASEAAEADAAYDAHRDDSLPDSSEE